MMKHLRDVEALEAQWADDPSWDLWQTEGFEEWREELRRFERVYWQKAGQAFDQQMSEKAEELGCPGNRTLATYITVLESRLLKLEAIVHMLCHKEA